MFQQLMNKRRESQENTGGNHETSNFQQNKSTSQPRTKKKSQLTRAKNEIKNQLQQLVEIELDGDDISHCDLKNGNTVDHCIVQKRQKQQKRALLLSQSVMATQSAQMSQFSTNAAPNVYTPMPEKRSRQQMTNKTSSNLKSLNQLSRIERTSQKQHNSISKLQNKLSKTQNLMVRIQDETQQMKDLTAKKGPFAKLPKQGAVTIFMKSKDTSVPKRGNGTKTAQLMTDDGMRFRITSNTAMRTPIRAAEKDRRGYDSNKIDKVNGARSRSNLSNVFNSTAGFTKPPAHTTMFNKQSMGKSPTAARYSPTTPPPRMTSQQKMNTSMSSNKKNAATTQQTWFATTTTAQSQSNAVRKQMHQTSSSIGNKKQVEVVLKHHQQQNKYASRQLQVRNLDLEKIGSDESADQCAAVSTQRRNTQATILHYRTQQEQMQARVDESQQSTTEGLLNIEQREVLSSLIDKLDLQQAIRQKARVYFNKEQQRLSINSSFADKSGARKQKTDDDYTPKTQKSSTGQQLLNPITKKNGKKDTNAENDADDKEFLQNMFSERKVATQNEIKKNLDKLMAKGAADNESKNGDDLTFVAAADRAAAVNNNSQENDTLQLTDGQIFDKEMVTLGTSIGNSIIPPDITINEQTIQVNEQAYDDENNNFPSARQKNTQKLNTDGSLNPHDFTNMRSISQVKFQKSNINTSSLPSIQVQGKKPNRPANLSVSRLITTESENMQEINLLALSKEYKRAQKAKMAKTMYNKRQAEPKHKLASFKQDYSQYVLGQYRFGLNQKPPMSTDPNAAPCMRFSQMACHRFAETNKRFMQLYDNQIMEYRKTRRFLSQQINKSPVGRTHAEQVHAESPLLKKMHRKLQLQLIDETIRQEEFDIKERMQNPTEKKEIKGLKEIQEHNRLMKAKRQKKPDINSENAVVSENASNSSFRRMQHKKGELFDKLLNAESVGSHRMLQQRSSILGLNSPNFGSELITGLDINEDCVSDASDEQKQHMKKATYEMDQIVTDGLFKNDQYKMGLSLYYMMQESEQRRHFRNQQKELMNYLNILFGGGINKTDHIDMAKNLTKKLRRQGTDDSHVRKRALEIQKENTQHLEIDESNINTEIIGLLAEEILKKTEFFDLFKGNVRGQKGLIQQSQLTRLQKQEDAIPTQFSSRKTILFKRVNAAMCERETVEDGPIPSFDKPYTNKGNSLGQLPGGGMMKREPNNVLQHLDTKILNEQMPNKANYLKQVALGANDLTQFETEMENVDDVHKEMAKTSFIQLCEKNLVVTLPLLLRIKDKKIVLERYQLNNGLCQALSIALSHFKDIATDFHLDSNNLSDDDFSCLLDGMCQLTYVQRLSYQHNTFGHKCLQSLMPIISKQQIKHSLRSLHLKNCKMTAKVTNDLLFSFNRSKNYIRCLSLVNVNVNQSNYLELCTLIRSSRHLIELDISWNGMRCQNMYQLINVIAENRTLQVLNLSFNNLYDSMQEKFSEATPGAKLKNIAEKEKLANKLKLAKNQTQKTVAEFDQMDNSMKHIMKLCRFIKMNNNLMHLNLSGMGMTQRMMHEFGRALRRTKSLVSLHLSSNNGDNEDLRTYLVERAHVKIFEPIFRPDFKQLENLEYKGCQETKAFKLENSIILRDKNDEETRQAKGQSKISEQLNLKNMLKNKRGSVNHQAEEFDASEMLVFTRYLGHKTEIPGSGQWRMIATANDSQERCWSCNLEVYSLVFWSREFGIKHEKELFRDGIDEMVYENQLYELEQRNAEQGISVDFNKDKGNPQLHDNGHKLIGYPQLYGEFNNWTPQRMYTIEELCFIMDSDKPDIIKNLKRTSLIRDTVMSVDEMNDKEKIHHRDQLHGLMAKYHRMKNWRKLLGSSLRYKRPFLANAEALLIGNEKVNIAKMDEELYPSDSESDFGSNSDAQSSFNDDESQSSGSPSAASRRSARQSSQKRQLNTNKYNKQIQMQKAQTRVSKIAKTTDKLNKSKKEMNRQLYVMPCFLKPGKQTFVVQSKVYETDIITNKAQNILAPLSDDYCLDDSQTSHLNQAFNGRNKNQIINTERTTPNNNEHDLTEQFFFHQVIVPHRRERIPLFVKQLKRKTNDSGAFDRDQTVFKDWKPPTEEDFKSMLEHDRKLWKLPRFIKDEEMLDKVFDVFVTHIQKLFNLFITMSAHSNFPGITWLDFTKFTEKLHITADGSVNHSDIDRYFMASAGDQQTSGCYRYQFLECIMRIAKARFLDSGQEPNYAAALNQFVMKYALQGPTQEWQEFRDNTWWTYQNHRILLANQSQITKIFKSFWVPRKNHMNKSDCIDLMVKKTKIMHDEISVIYCYGMSKMHIVEEIKNKPKYEEMIYVEFLEFLGRCAYQKYRDMEEEPMHEKLKMLLDELMPFFGMHRKEVEDEEEELSESDPDY